MKPRIVLHSSAVDQILNSAAVDADMERRARAIATAAGPGFEVRDRVTDRRGKVVLATTVEAMRAEARTRALTRALDAGR